jgi:hypothetical protein
LNLEPGTQEIREHNQHWTNCHRVSRKNDEAVTAMMRWVLVFASLGEAATGAALLIAPSLVGQLLVGQALTGIAMPVGRVAGIALIALALACWPGREAASRPAVQGMLCYSLPVTLYLAYLGIGAEWGGILLWPAVVLHAILTALLSGAWFKAGRE